MTEGEFKRWEIGKLKIKPGDILVFRYHRPTFPAPGGRERPLDAEECHQVFKSAEKRIREALDKVGLTSDRVPLLLLTEDWDIHAISPLELMDKCVTAERAKDAR